MKNKSIKLIAVLTAVICVLTGCSESAGTHAQTGSQSIAQVIQSGMDEADGSVQAVSETGTDADIEADLQGDDTDAAAGSGADTVADTETGGEDESNIDVDLSVLSGGLVYSEVYNMMSDPNSYIGKVIKMTGSYSYYYDEMEDKEYHACIIQDATACCAQGIEFEPTADFVYPTDFPATGQDITVIGVFDIYYEADFVFMTLRDAKII